MKRNPRITRKQKRKKFKTIANWLRSKAEKRRREEAKRLDREFDGEAQLKR